MFDSCFQQLSLHTDFILNTAIWSGQTRSILFFPAGSLPPRLLICVTPHKFSSKWDHMPFLSPFLLLILALDIFFPSHLNLHLNIFFFFFKSLLSVFSEWFPSSSPLLRLPAASCFRAQICNTWSDDTLDQMCVCICVRNKRKKLCGNCFVWHLSKLCSRCCVSSLVGAVDFPYSISKYGQMDTR